MTENKVININNKVLDRCRNGEADAQFILYRMYSKAMFNIAIRFMNNRMDAEDILQESFFTAFDQLNKLDNNAAFGSWLKRIVINNCITSLKKTKPVFEDIAEFQPVVSDDLDDDFTEPDPQIVHELIKELPAGGRMILVLHALEGFKHREISEMLSISESTSKSQYRRALEILSERIKKQVYVKEA